MVNVYTIIKAISDKNYSVTNDIRCFVQFFYD